MKYVWIDWSCIDYKKYPFRRSFANHVSHFEFPVDRFNVTGGRCELITHPIVNAPVYDLSNITMDFEDRYYALLDEVADNVYKTAGDRTIYLSYSGGVDSVCILAALQRNPKYKEFMEQDRIVMAMTSTSIDEYPHLFYKEILPNFRLEVLNYNKLMNDPNALLVNGDLGDYVISTSDTFKYSKDNPSFDMMKPYKDIYPYLRKDKDSEFLIATYDQAMKGCPFDIHSISQYAWWMSTNFVTQIDLCRPYFWSTTEDFSEISTNNKIFRYFYDPAVMKFTFEYMSTNPVLHTYEDCRVWPKKYIVNHFGDEEFYNKPKVYSQSKTFRVVYKSKLIYDGNKIVSAMDGKLV